MEYMVFSARDWNEDLPRLLNRHADNRWVYKDAFHVGDEFIVIMEREKG